MDARMGVQGGGTVETFAADFALEFEGQRLNTPSKDANKPDAASPPYG
jgi:hypothetical protein